MLFLSIFEASIGGAFTRRAYFDDLKLNHAVAKSHKFLTRMPEPQPQLLPRSLYA